MTRRLGIRARRPSPATVVSVIALVVALSGVAVAAIPTSDGTINGCYSNSTGVLRVIDTDAGQNCTSGQTPISWKTGTNPAGGDLSGNYPNPQIGAGTIGSPEIANAQVKTADIGPQSVTTSRLGPSSVTSPKVLNDSLTGSDILESGLGKVPDADTLDGKDSSLLGQIAGWVNADGSIFSGSGFTVARPSPGVYDISFPAGTFTGASGVALVAQTFSGCCPPTSTRPVVTIVRTGGDGSASFRVRMTKPDGSFQDDSFFFIAVQT